MLYRIFVALAALLFTTPAWADAPPTQDWSDIETVVVHAEARGPALWRVSRGDAEVWIFAVLGPLPENFVWNDTGVSGKIAGAKRLYLPAEASTGLASLSWFMLTHWGIFSVPRGQKMTEGFSADLQARFEAAVQASGRKPDRYASDKPQVAAWRLEADFLKARKLTAGNFEEHLARIARAKAVKTERLGRYDVIPLLQEYLQMPPASGQICLRAALEDLENWQGHAVAAAEAWAVGDIAGVRAHYAPQALEGCMASRTANYGRLEARAVGDAVRAIDAALSSPGKSVLIMDIGTLLRQEGVVAALQKQGLRVEQVGG